MVPRYKRLIGVAFIIALFSCAPDSGIFDSTKYDEIDPDLALSRDDYKDFYAPRIDGSDGEIPPLVPVRPKIPSVAPILAAPRPPRIGKTKLVSITVTDDVPLKDVLIELSRLADVDVEIDPGIRGGINFRAKSKPFNEVVERVSKMAGLRYTMQQGVLRVERDLPYIKNYSIDFLNVERNSTSSVSISTDVLSSSVSGGGGESGGGDSGGGSGSGGAGGLSTGSSASIDLDNTSDLWEALGLNIQMILSNDQSLLNQLEQAEAQQSTDTANENFVLNRQAGVLSVAATERQHDSISHYLKHVRRNATAQVLIEAKILEVGLNDEYRSGIDWSAAIGNNNFDFGFTPGFTDANNLFNYTLDSGDNNLGINLDSVVQLAQIFGTTRTLSSPRLHAINNQQAVLTFAENRVFFDLEFETETEVSTDSGSSVSPPTLTGDAVSVPIGIILSIIPSINLDSNEVTLNVRPTLSRQISTVSDPVAAFANQSSGGTSISNDIPVIEVRELDSVMKIKSGNVLVIGGLMQDDVSNADQGLPYLSEIPWVGNAFKGVEKTANKTELIILIKATIVNSDTGLSDPIDRHIYHKFSDDPRPVTF